MQIHLFKSIQFIIFSLIFCLCAQAQDMIYTTEGGKIASKIVKVGDTIVEYKRATNTLGRSKFIGIKDIVKIIYENGNVQGFGEVENTNEEVSVEGLKSLLVNLINEYGYEEDSFENRFRASFEDDGLMRIVELKSNNTKEKTKNLRYVDFSNLYELKDVYEKGDAYFLDIYADARNNSKDNPLKKNRLLIRIDGEANAQQIHSAILKLNDLLK